MTLKKPENAELKIRTWFESVSAFKVEICLVLTNVFCILSLLWFMVVEVPNHEYTFSSMNVELPAITEGLIAFSHVLSEWCLVLFPAGIGLFFILCYLGWKVKLDHIVADVVPFMILLVALCAITALDKYLHYAVYAPMIPIGRIVG